MRLKYMIKEMGNVTGYKRMKLVSGQLGKSS